MRRRSTQPLHTISFTIAVGLGVISDPITAVGWPVSNPPWFLCSVQLSSVMCGPLDCQELAVDLWKLYESRKVKVLVVSLSMGFSRQEYWSGLPCSPLADLPDPGVDLGLLPRSLALQADFFFTIWATRKSPWIREIPNILIYFSPSFFFFLTFDMDF